MTGAATQTDERSQFIRYVLAGGVNTVFAFTAFVVLQAILPGERSYLAALCLAHVLSVIEAFILARLFVFKVRGPVVRDFLRFWSIYLTAFVANLVALPVLVEILNFPVLPAQAAFLAASAVVTYLLHRSFSFHRKPGVTTAGADDVPQVLTDVGPLTSAETRNHHE